MEEVGCESESVRLLLRQRLWMAALGIQQNKTQSELKQAALEKQQHSVIQPLACAPEHCVYICNLTHPLGSLRPHPHLSASTLLFPAPCLPLCVSVSLIHLLPHVFSLHKYIVKQIRPRISCWCRLQKQPWRCTVHSSYLKPLNKRKKSRDAVFFPPNWILPCLIFPVPVQKFHMHTSECVYVLLPSCVCTVCECSNIHEGCLNAIPSWTASRLLGLLCADLSSSLCLCHWDVPLSLPASRSASYAVIRHSRSLSGASAVLLRHYIAVQL